MKMEYENGLLRMENAAGRRGHVANADKPPSAASPGQLTSDLKAFAYGLINSVVMRLGYDNLLNVQITGREGSSDLRAAEARRVLAYVDSIWNAYRGLAAQIGATPISDLKSLRDYANLFPQVPDMQHFTCGPAVPVTIESAATTSARKPSVPASERALEPSSGTVSLETPSAEAADFSRIIDRALVFDDFFSETHVHLLEQWALQTPHWMLTNSTHDELGRPLHRIWGASYIGAWQRAGWTGLPPILFSTVAAIFQKLNVTITAPRYIGLNGQSRGQDASIHEDCERDLAGEISILVYIGEDVDGDLILYDKDNSEQVLHRIAFRPNRVIAFDGSIPHQALAPTSDRFRMSLVIRGQYECRRSDLAASPAPSPEKD